MTGLSKWETLRAWLDTEQDAALDAASVLTASLRSLTGGTSDRAWNDAMKAAAGAQSRAMALIEVARKMSELDRDEEARKV